LLLQEAGRNAIIAIKGHVVVEESCDAIPARGSGRLEALHASGRGYDYVAATHGAADENDFNFDSRSGR
jgi:hypothetical protein